MCRPRAVASAAARALVLALAAGAAAAQTVTLQGSIGSRAALLVIDGQPRTVAVGATVQGVTLLSMDGQQAHVLVGGQRRTLALGAAPVALGAATAPSDSGREIVLAAGPGGHFTTLGSINGRAVTFMVDTGASVVALGRAQAETLGLRWRDGAKVPVGTANGTVAGHAVTLDRVRVGDVEVPQVAAIVMPMDLPHVLLGNSFLQRFQMTRSNDVMRLELRR